MKPKTVSTNPLKSYVAEYYVKRTVFPVRQASLDYSGWYATHITEKIPVVNCGSYRLDAMEKFASASALVERLKELYPNRQYISFYQTLSQALKDGQAQASYLVVREVGVEDTSQKLQFQLKRNKKYNPASPKRRKRYRCCCWLCGGNDSEHFYKIQARDEKKLGYE